MKIHKLMTSHARTCRPEDDLMVPAREMWEGDCGVIPVVDPEEHVVGMITDRDICMAAYTQNRPLSHIRVRDVMSKQVAACRTDEEVERAEQLMRQRQVRRLAVVDPAGKLEGVLSLNDIALAAAPSTGERRGRGPAPEEVMEVLAAVCEHRGGMTERPEEQLQPAGRGRG